MRPIKTILQIIKIVAFTIFTGVLLFSCSPERKLNRLLSKHPHLIERDTVFYKDTVIVQGVKKDTVFSLQNLLRSDTLIIVKDRLTQKIYYKDSLIYLSGECATDTIYKDNFRVVEKITIEKGRGINDYLLYALIAFFVIALIYRLKVF